MRRRQAFTIDITKVNAVKISTQIGDAPICAAPAESLANTMLITRYAMDTPKDMPENTHAAVRQEALLLTMPLANAAIATAAKANTKTYKTNTTDESINILLSAATCSSSAISPIAPSTPKNIAGADAPADARPSSMDSTLNGSRTIAKNASNAPADCNA